MKQEEPLCPSWHLKTGSIFVTDWCLGQPFYRQLLSVTCRSVCENLPLHFCELIPPHVTPSRSLRSASKSVLDVPGSKDRKNKATWLASPQLPPLVNAMPCPRVSGRQTVFSLSGLLLGHTSFVITRSNFCCTWTGYGAPPDLRY